MKTSITVPYLGISLLSLLSGSAGWAGHRRGSAKHSKTLSIGEEVKSLTVYVLSNQNDSYSVTGLVPLRTGKSWSVPWQQKKSEIHPTKISWKFFEKSENSRIEKISKFLKISISDFQHFQNFENFENLDLKILKIFEFWFFENLKSRFSKILRFFQF